MERREFVFAAGLATVATAVGKSAFAAEKAHDHMAMMATASKELVALRESAQNCGRAAEACLAHSNAMAMAGDGSMAECQNGILNLIPVIDAMARVAQLNSTDKKMIKALAATCADFCRSCEEQCKKHLTVKVCKECAEASVKCAKACDAYIAA